MYRPTFSIVAAVALFLLAIGPGQAWQGTAFPLGAGKELCLDLPLEPDKSYEISINLRSELEAAVIAMTLRYQLENDQIVDYKTVIQDLAATNGWRRVSLEVTTPAPRLRWELIITAEQKGLYWWDSLAVSGREGKRGTREFWDEKLAQGPFYTGLVVDARHLPLQRGMSPRIYSETGQLIYGGVLAPKDLIQDRGVVTYGQDLTPELLKRLQLDVDYPYISPLIIKAKSVVEPSRTGVYISEEDTERILAAMVQYDFLARYAVIFLLN